MKRLFVLYFLIILFGPISSRAQEPAVRIPGLEKNETYMSCLKEDARLQERIDSLMAESASIRRSFRDDPENREHYKEEILKLEERLFALRSEKGQLVDRINAIEQEWILRSLDAAPAGGEPERDEELPSYDDAPGRGIWWRTPASGASSRRAITPPCGRPSQGAAGGGAHRAVRRQLRPADRHAGRIPDCHGSGGGRFALRPHGGYPGGEYAAGRFAANGMGLHSGQQELCLQLSAAGPLRPR